MVRGEVVVWKEELMREGIWGVRQVFGWFMIAMVATAWRVAGLGTWQSEGGSGQGEDSGWFHMAKLGAGESGDGWIWVTLGKEVMEEACGEGNGARTRVRELKWECGGAGTAKTTLLTQGRRVSGVALDVLQTPYVSENSGRSIICQLMSRLPSQNGLPVRSNRVQMAKVWQQMGRAVTGRTFRGLRGGASCGQAMWVSYSLWGESMLRWRARGVPEGGRQEGEARLLQHHWEVGNRCREPRQGSGAQRLSQQPGLRQRRQPRPSGRIGLRGVQWNGLWRRSLTGRRKSRGFTLRANWKRSKKGRSSCQIMIRARIKHSSASRRLKGHSRKRVVKHPLSSTSPCWMARRSCKKGGREKEAAREALERARRATAEVLEAEGKAEAWVRACATREENCRLRNAHLAFQLAVEATVGVEGYKELEEKLYYLHAKLATDKDAYAREAFGSIAWFVSKFAPQSYNKQEDPLLRDLASSDSDETALVGQGGGADGGAEVEKEIGKEGSRMQHDPPKAFDTPIAAAEATRLAKIVGGKSALPAAFGNASGKEDTERKKAVSTKRATEGRRARSEERLVQSKADKKSAKARATSVARPKGGKKGDEEVRGQGSTVQGMEVDLSKPSSRGRPLVRPRSARTATRSPRLDVTRGLPKLPLAIIATEKKDEKKAGVPRPRSVSAVSAGSQGRKGGNSKGANSGSGGNGEDGGKQEGEAGLGCIP